MIFAAAEAGPIATPRTAARVLLVDADRRVLLMHERRDIGSDRSHWITPGGGVEPGETLAVAAARELFEETGLTAQLGAQPILRDEVTFTIDGSTYRQTNHYFFARSQSDVAVLPAGHTEIERLVVLGHRWWPLDELAMSDADVEPADIVAILGAQLDGEVPR